MKTQLLAITATLLCAAVAPAQEQKEVDDVRNPVAGQPAAIAAGRKLFVEGCSGCHGTNGEGGRGAKLQGDIVREASNRQLLASIKSGIKGTEMPPSTLPEENIWQMIAFLRDLTSPAADSLVSGDSAAGEALYFGKAGCSNCHMIHGRGGFLGPDLSDAGRLHTFSQLREAILDPNATIADGFVGVTVTMRDGKTISGVAKDNTNYAIQILDRQGELHRLQKKDLKEVVFRKRSLMPQDYKQRLSAADVGNLLAYLSRQTVRAAAAKEGSK